MSEYPTDEELGRIKEWSHGDFRGCFDFVRSLWSYPDFWEDDGRHIRCSTGGWSGNEALIDALHDAGAGIIWFMSWQQSRRGGHYEFEIPQIAENVA